MGEPREDHQGPSYYICHAGPDELTGAVCQAFYFGGRIRRVALPIAVQTALSSLFGLLYNGYRRIGSEFPCSLVQI